MQNDFLFRLAEQQYLTSPEDLRQPPRCPICGSIDISAGGVCRHCNTELEECTYEKRRIVG
jgi:tRNA(Ile2) C34 agmatinyltransferase TiaS